eukprot:scaffold834_cov311-Prasinococcus_capsulatus_cf.AAC.11
MRPLPASTLQPPRGPPPPPACPLGVPATARSILWPVRPAGARHKAGPRRAPPAAHRARVRPLRPLQPFPAQPPRTATVRSRQPRNATLPARFRRCGLIGAMDLKGVLYKRSETLKQWREYRVQLAGAHLRYRRPEEREWRGTIVLSGCDVQLAPDQRAPDKAGAGAVAFKLIPPPLGGGGGGGSSSSKPRRAVLLAARGEEEAQHWVAALLAAAQLAPEVAQADLGAGDWQEQSLGLSHDVPELHEEVRYLRRLLDQTRAERRQALLDLARLQKEEQGEPAAPRAHRADGSTPGHDGDPSAAAAEPTPAEDTTTNGAEDDDDDDEEEEEGGLERGEADEAEFSTPVAPSAGPDDRALQEQPPQRRPAASEGDGSALALFEAGAQMREREWQAALEAAQEQTARDTRRQHELQLQLQSLQEENDRWAPGVASARATERECDAGVAVGGCAACVTTRRLQQSLREAEGAQRAAAAEQAALRERAEGAARAREARAEETAALQAQVEQLRADLASAETRLESVQFLQANGHPLGQADRNGDGDGDGDGSSNGGDAATAAGDKVQELEAALAAEATKLRRTTNLLQEVREANVALVERAEVLEAENESLLEQLKSSQGIMGRFLSSHRS